DCPTEKPNNHISSVSALSGSDLINAVWRDSKAAQLRVFRSIGWSRVGFADVTASNRLCEGLSLQAASRAKPNDGSASPYMRWPPDRATENPSSHMTVLMGSAPTAGASD